MAIIKAVSSRASIGKVINYVTGNEKTEERLISGIDCSPSSALDEMKFTKKRFGKTDGRQYMHFIQSFPHGEKITHEKAHEIARELATNRFKGYEVLIATHRDKAHIHTHIIVNSVSHVDGLKFRQSKAGLQGLKNWSDKLCRALGLSIEQKRDNPSTYSKNPFKHSAIMEGLKPGGSQSWVVECAAAVLDSKSVATSRADFIDKMHESGWKTKWADNRKYIVFENNTGQRIRDKTLEQTAKEPLRKEDLEREFSRNAECAERSRAEQRSGAAVGHESRTGGIPAAETGTTIAQLRATLRDSRSAADDTDTAIRESRTAVEADERQRGNKNTDEQSRHSERDRVEKSRVTERIRESDIYVR